MGRSERSCSICHHPRTPMSSLPASGSQRVSLSSATAPTDFGRLWDDALQRYRVETGNELLTLPMVKECPSHPRGADEIVAYFEKQEKAFSAFRANGEKIRGVLKPVVDIVLFLGKVAEGASVSSNSRYLSHKMPSDHYKEYGSRW
jgi:hypothetical protein